PERPAISGSSTIGTNSSNPGSPRRASARTAGLWATKSRYLVALEWKLQVVGSHDPVLSGPAGVGLVSEIEADLHRPTFRDVQRVPERAKRWHESEQRGRPRQAHGPVILLDEIHGQWALLGRDSLRQSRVARTDFLGAFRRRRVLPLQV